ncbi:DUF4158 domain-containing protein [Streptomyces javensis]|uniref:DUF4158 domain-containing protein n=1 Tax=Streptomyces javensis TaxID=114698 RepID=A0ABS0R3P6_9ACTN|nr:DUF4158 domain-containing protein [Streptomyces javensis]
MTSIERTAYPRFKRLITAHELHLFFAPTREEAAWAAERMDSDGHQLALLLALKSYQRMGRFPKPDEYPEMVVDFVRRTVELPEGTLPLYETGRTAERQRAEVRQRVGTKYQQSQARQIAEAAIRKEAASKNRPADLINIALEKVVAAGLELPAFSTFDLMTSTVRTEVNASICRGIHDRMSAVQRAGLLRLPEERDSDGTTQFNRLKQTAQAPTWSHFKRLCMRLEWLDALGDSAVWVDGVAAPKVTDFAGEADAADASELRDYAAVKRVALLACLAHKARMRVRDDLATMFCKRVAMKIKKAKEELEEIRLAEREIVERLIGNYRTVLKNLDADGPAQEALERAAAMSAEAVRALDGLDEAAPAEEVARRLGGDISPAVLALVQAQLVQAGGLGAVTRAVEGFGGFAGQYEQIEKVSAHHGNFWEVLLYGQIGRDRSVMFDLAEKLEFTATSEDGRVWTRSRTRCATRVPAVSTSARSARMAGRSTSPSPRRTGARPCSTGRVRGGSCASTSRRWSSPTSPRNCARETSRWWARRSTRTGPHSCWPGRTSRTSSPTTWWMSGCARRARPAASTGRPSAGSWRTSCGPPPRRRMPGIRTTRAWSSTRPPASPPSRPTARRDSGPRRSGWSRRSKRGCRNAL